MRLANAVHTYWASGLFRLFPMCGFIVLEFVLGYEISFGYVLVTQEMEQSTVFLPLNRPIHVI